MKTILNEGVKVLKGSKSYKGKVPSHILPPELKEALPKLEEQTKKGKDAEAKFFKSREPKKPVASIVTGKPKQESKPEEVKIK